MPRLRRLPRRLRGAPGAFAALGLAAWAGFGAFIYYNTNILNRYQTSPEGERETAGCPRRRSSPTNTSLSRASPT